MRKILLLSLVLSCRFLLAQSVIYVNHAATGANDGSSWADAYLHLQFGLDAAQAGDQIWVAKGTYYPISGATGRNLFFELKDSVGVYGGFLGNETKLTQRNWKVNQTVLSGDIGVQWDMSDNVYSVVRADNVSLSNETVLDGFTVSHANCFVTSSTYHSGGGILVYSTGRVVLKNLHITNNKGWGVYNKFGRATILNCKVEGNDLMSREKGRGIYTYGGQTTIVNSVIGPNINASIRVNKNRDRSEIYQSGGRLRIVGSTIVDGLKDCAIYVEGSLTPASLSNTLIADSILSYPFSGSQPPPNIYLKNCLARHSKNQSGGWNISGIIDLGGNIDTVPIFMGLYNFNLFYRSPGVNGGFNDSIPLDIWDMDYDGITAEPYPDDFAGKQRLVDGVVDIGAFEYMPAWTDTVFQAVCAGDSSIFNGQYFADEGVYKHTYTPDSAQYLSLDIDTPNVDVQVWFNGILEAKADSVQYEWIDCNDTARDLGAMQKVFYPSKNGDYKVVITTPEGCIDTSACYNVYAIGLDEQLAEDYFAVFPNPAKNKLTIRLSDERQILTLAIKSISGQSLVAKQVKLQGQSEFQINVEALPAGVYILEVNGRMKRFVKGSI